METQLLESIEEELAERDNEIEVLEPSHNDWAFFGWLVLTRPMRTRQWVEYIPVMFTSPEEKVIMPKIH